MIDRRHLKSARRSLTLIVLILAMWAVGRGALGDEAAWTPPVTRELIEKQFSLFDPDFKQRHGERYKRLLALEWRFAELGEQGVQLPCTDQLLNEAKWLISSTTEWARIDRQYWLAAASMLDAGQDIALEQMIDGSWGGCYDRWFLKLDSLIDALNSRQAVGMPLLHELNTLKPISTPEDMVARLANARLSDIAATGFDHRQELNEYAAVLAQLVFKEPLRKYLSEMDPQFRITDAHRAAFVRFAKEWQDPETGFWGAWYRVDGAIRKATDLSITYHLIAYNNDDVRHWDRLVDTVLALRDHRYPYGWRDDTAFNDHNSYDVIRLLHKAWEFVGPAQRKRAATAIEELLNWTLNTSLRADGGFNVDPSQDTVISDTNYYGVSVLVSAGYCSEKPAFWTDRTWPNAQATCCKIAARLVQQVKAGVPEFAARDRMAEAMPSCPAFQRDAG